VDFKRMIPESWKLTRTTRPLWGLGAISVAQVLVYAFITVGLIAPMSVLTQLVIQQAQQPDASTPLSAFTNQAAQWLSANATTLFAGIGAVVLVWVILGVLDVAATGGTIGQTIEAIEGRPASVSAGLREGFRIWWRTIGLLAISALPALLYLLPVAFFMLTSVTLPMMQGRAPNMATAQAGNLFTGLFSTVVSIVSVPLIVLVQLGLRFAVVESQEWRQAMRSAWGVARGRLSDVILTYLVQIGITTVVGVIAGIAVSIIGLPAVGAVYLLALRSQSVAAVVVAVIVALLIALLSGFLLIGVMVWYSVFWTLAWRRLTHPAEQPPEVPYVPVAWRVTG
jgi:hypothetical protein